MGRWRQRWSCKLRLACACVVQWAVCAGEALRDEIHAAVASEMEL